MIILVSIFFTVAIVLGIKIVTHEGMVLHDFKNKVGRKLGCTLAEPLICCEWCMPSVWSSIGWASTFMYFSFVGNPLSAKWILFYPITISVSSLISGTIWVIVEILLLLLKHNKQD